MSQAVHLDLQQRKCLLEAGDVTVELAKRLPYKPRAEDRVPMQKCFACGCSAVETTTVLMTCNTDAYVAQHALQ